MVDPAAGCGGAEGTARCLLCASADVALFQYLEGRLYWRCGTCALTYLDPGQRLLPEDEFNHYLSHENDVDDPGYRRFLSRLSAPLLQRLPPGSRGIDYGCGPGPALAHMLREAGHHVALYDPFFVPDKAVLRVTYDFITCTEVAEHFHEPANEFARFDAMLRPGGLLGLMTSFQTDDTRFATWHYRRDPSHVSFYKRDTLAFMADRMGWRFESPAKDIALMWKPASVTARS
ncbi:MAG: class I SAM-dependent methyltransferase [Alphaproteobacteria bacterium]|nr:class I SAM-dependent methyltransferase [Alphaproteobacteria bacterium]